MDVPYLSGSPDGDNVEVGLQAGVQQPVKVNQLAGGVVPHLGDHVIIHLYCVAFFNAKTSRTLPSFCGSVIHVAWFASLYLSDPIYKR